MADDGADPAADGREEGVGRLPVRACADPHQDQRPVPADQSDQLLPPDAPQRAAGRGADRRASIEELEDTGELNIGASRIEGVGNFRISAHCASAAPIAAVIRYIPTDIPPLDIAAVPMILADLIMEKRGLILMVGATGSRQEHHARPRCWTIATSRCPATSSRSRTRSSSCSRNKKSVVNQREVGSDTSRCRSR